MSDFMKKIHFLTTILASWVMLNIVACQQSNTTSQSDDNTIDSTATPDYKPKIDKNGLYNIAHLYKLPEFNSIEEALKNPQNVYRLNLRKQMLNKLPEEIAQFTNLQELNLSDNPIEELPESLKNLKKIQILHIGKTNLKEIPTVVYELPHLQVLNISGLLMAKLPETLSQCTQLTSLDADFCGLEEFSEVLLKMKTLERLSLKGNLINQLPQNIGTMESLAVLKLTENSIQQLPASFVKLKKLRSLDLSGNPLKNIPTEISQLAQLKLLYLNNLKIETQDYSPVATLANLQELGMENNQIEKLPQDFFAKMVNLRTLKIKGNKITNLPTSINQCKYLQTLDISRNPDLDVSTTVKMLNTSRLNRINLSGTKLDGDQWAEELSTLKTLKILQLSYNQFEEPEKALKKIILLNQLEELDISGSNLPLGNEITEMKNLKRLKINGLNEYEQNELAKKLPNTKIISI